MKMKLFVEKVVPLSTMLFTALMVVTAISNLARGSWTIDYVGILIHLACFFAASFLEYYGLEQINFKSNTAYLLCSFLSWYILIGICQYVTGWTRNIALYTVFMVVLYGCITQYQLFRTRRQTEEINRLLEQRRGGK